MSIEIQQIPDYNDFIELLIQQYKDKPLFSSLLSSTYDQANDIESAVFEIKVGFYIDSAIGAQLDTLGLVIGIDRDGRDDESYRTLLKVKAEINFGSGELETVIKTVKSLYNATQIQVTPVYPAKVQIWQDGDLGLYLTFTMELDDTGLLELDDGGILEVQQPDDIAEELLTEVLAAGVGLLLADDLILDDNGFLFLDDGGHLILT